jgi:hypothetical protein
MREPERASRPHRSPHTSREKQLQLLDLALAHVEQQTKTTGAADPGEFMINRVVEVDEDGSCADFPLPESR